MNRTQICNLVLARIGRRETDAYAVAQAKLELTLVQERLEGGAFLPWFLLTSEQTLTTVASTREVALPDNFLREWDDYPLQFYDSTASPAYMPLTKDDFDVHLAEFGEADDGEPQAYALSGVVFDLFPTPDYAYPLKWRYFARDAVLSDSVLTNNWTANAADLLVAELGVVMAGYARRDDLVNLFAAQKAEALKRLTAFDIARKQAALSAFRGDRSN